MARESDNGFLLKVYRAVRELVPATAEVVDGFTVFTTEQDLKVLVAKKLGVSEGKANTSLAKLRDLNVYKAKSAGRGNPWWRHLKLNAEEIVTAAGEGKQVDSGGGGAASTLAVEATPEQLNELWEQLTVKLDGQAAEIVDLAQQLESEKTAHEATRQELELLKAAPPTPTFILPAGLAKHLGS